MNQISSFGPFSSERKLTKWLKTRGQNKILNELDLLFCDKFGFESIERFFSTNNIPDIICYSKSSGHLVIIDACDSLTKGHFGKDLLYLYEQFSGGNKIVNRRSLVWLVNNDPSNDIKNRINMIHNISTIDGSSPGFYIFKLLYGKDNKDLKIRPIYFEGKAYSIIDNTYSLINYKNNNQLVAPNQAANILGTKPTTISNLIKSSKISCVNNRIEVKEIRRYINKLESESGYTFISSFQLDFSQYCLPREATKLLGYKNTQIRGLPKRKGLSPRFITIKGSSRKGFSLVFSRSDIKKFMDENDT